jgi:hypothetical protein
MGSDGLAFAELPHPTTATMARRTIRIPRIFFTIASLIPLAADRVDGRYEPKGDALPETERILGI